MEARRRARGRRERVRLAEGEAKGHGPTFFAEQRGLVTDGEDVHERRSGRRWQVDLPSGCRFVPSSENQGSQIRWIGGLPPRRWFKRLSVSVRTVRWRVRIHDHPSYQQEDWAIVNSNRIGSERPFDFVVERRVREEDGDSRVSSALARISGPSVSANVRWC
jgi:hypothetical protein